MWHLHSLVLSKNHAYVHVFIYVVQFFQLGSIAIYSYISKLLCIQLYSYNVLILVCYIQPYHEIFTTQLSKRCSISCHQRINNIQLYCFCAAYINSCYGFFQAPYTLNLPSNIIDHSVIIQNNVILANQLVQSLQLSMFIVLHQLLCAIYYTQLQLYIYYIQLLLYYIEVIQYYESIRYWKTTS